MTIRWRNICGGLRRFIKKSEVVQLKEKQFYAAMYLRLSRDDRDRDGLAKSESDSIGSQRELVKSFLQEQSDIELYDIYVDDGFSGSNFVEVR